MTIEIRKALLRSARAGLRRLAHVALIPPVAALKGLAVFFTHLHDELAKV